jgi:hypothetical protein
MANILKPGDCVMYREGKKGFAPTGMKDKIFTVQCVDSCGNVYLLSGEVKGANCDCGGRHSWFTRPDEVEIVGHQGLIGTMYGKPTYITTDFSPPVIKPIKTTKYEKYLVDSFAPVIDFPTMYNKPPCITNDTISSIWENYAVKRMKSHLDLEAGQIIYTSDKPKMSLIQKFKQLVMSEPQKTFSKFGILDSEGDLTTEGRVLFTQFLLSKFGTEFKADVLDKMEAPKTE